MKLEYTKNERLELIFQLKNTIKQLRELQYINNRKCNQNEISEDIHTSVNNCLKSSIDTKMWCLLENIDKLENDLTIKNENEVLENE